MPRGKISNLKIYQGNKSVVKGKLFELVLKQLLTKAGFSTNIVSDQLTRNQKRLHGRGATYDPDVMGQFEMGIPFVNPIMIVGEAKNYNHQVKLSNAREFLGAYIDFSQYERVNTKAGGNARYSSLYNTRFTYCPIYFSAKGFQKSAEGFMFVHGINYISYQNSDVIAKFFVLIDSILDQLNFSKFTSDDFRQFNDLNTLENVRDEIKKRGFNRSLSDFISYLNKVNSIVAVLDRKYPIHILYEKGVFASLFKQVQLEPVRDGVYILQNVAGRKFGEFSLSTTFIKEYINYATKKDILDSIFKQIDIIISYKGAWEIRQLLIENTSRERLFNAINPTPTQEPTGDSIPT